LDFCLCASFGRVESLSTVGTYFHQYYFNLDISSAMSEGGKYALTGLALVKGAVCKHYNLPLGGTTVIVNITDKTRGQIKIDITGATVSLDSDLVAISNIAQEGISGAIECQTFQLDLSNNSYGDVIFDKKKVSFQML
jgi:hypothetical protein